MNKFLIHYTYINKFKSFLWHLGFDFEWYHGFYVYYENNKIKRIYNTDIYTNELRKLVSEINDTGMAASLDITKEEYNYFMNLFSKQNKS
jgi:hypothetical protein